MRVTAPRLTLGSHPDCDTDWLGGALFVEATCKAAEEKAGRQIDHPFSIAFQELGPRGGWRHGSIFWTVAQIQCTVCGVKLLPTHPHYGREK